MSHLHRSQHQSHVRPVAHNLHVVTAISNPERYRSRYDLFRAFEKMVADAGAVLHVAELALGDRHHEITDPCNEGHHRFRTPHQLWHKENLLNLTMARLPADWKYVAWVDADVAFARPDWAAETIHQLQHFDVVQMFSHAQDLGPQNQPVGKVSPLNRSFLSSWEEGLALPKNLIDPRPNPQVQESTDLESGSGSGGSSNRSGSGSGEMIPTAGHYWHSGFAWAARRSAIDTLGGLGDISIVGSADHHMAAALVGRVDRTIHPRAHPNYRKYWRRWQERASLLRQNVGHVPGLLLHYWHGSKRNRRYVERWDVMVANGYDPEADLKYDSQGVLQLTERNPRLRDDVRRYFRQRNEDGVDL